MLRYTINMNLRVVAFVIFQLINISSSREIEYIDSTTTDNLVTDLNVDIDTHANWNLLDEEICGNSIADRIIGGENASLGQYPWIARLGYTSLKKSKPNVAYSCGGVLITPCYVLTAAHCVSDLPQKLYLSTVRLGEYNTDTYIDCNEDECADPVQDFEPEKIIIHTDYNTPKHMNDIALIKLKVSAIITVWVSPICLPRGQLLYKNITGEIADVAGWGKTNIKKKKGSNILQTLKVPLLDISECKEKFRRFAHIDDKQLCAGGTIGKDSCAGDSGGPLMKVDTLTIPKTYVFGIVSFGPKNCGKRAAPGVYTKVVEFIEWILDNISDC